MSGSASRLGDLLIKRKIIAPEQLEEALRTQQESPKYVPLGQVLIDMGLITRRQLHLVLAGAKKHPKLGEVLVRSGTIDAAQLERALDEQKKTKLPLGETLVRLGYSTEEAMRQALCLQVNVPYLNLDNVRIDPALARLVNRSFNLFMVDAGNHAFFVERGECVTAAWRRRCVHRGRHAYLQIV